MVGNGGKWWEMVGNDWNWLEMHGNVWKCMRRCRDMCEKKEKRSLNNTATWAIHYLCLKIIRTY